MATAGHDLNITSTLGPVHTETHSTQQGKTHVTTTTTTQGVDTQALQAGGNLQLQAGHDVNLTAAHLQAGQGIGVAAGHDLNATTLTSTDTSHTSASRKRFNQTTQTRDETVHGTDFQAGSGIALHANTDANLSAASVHSANGGVAVSAGRDINLLAVQEQHDFSQDMSKTKHGTFNTKRTTTHDESHDSLAVTSSLSGDTVQVQAGNDVHTQGAQIVGTGDVALVAGHDLDMASAENTHSEVHDVKKTKSGIYGGGGLNVTAGKQQSTVHGTLDSTAHTNSTIGSLGGNVALQAGNTLAISGSTVTALQGDVIGQGKQIAITDIQDTDTQTQKQTFKQTGVTASITSSALSLAQTAQGMVKAAHQAKDSGDTRMQALAGASTAMSGYHAYQAANALANGQGSAVNVSVSVGSSKSSSESTRTSSQSHGSSINAGGNVALIASGGGEHSDLNVRGSTIQAGQNALLSAEHDVTLEAGQNTFEQHSTSKSSSGSVGVGYSAGPNGGGFGVTLSASGARGNADGTDVTHSTTHVTAGQTASVISGHDTTLRGAQLAGQRVTADVGHDLNIESLQDTSTYDSKDKSVGGSVTMGAGFAVSGSYSNNKVNGDFASVHEQSGIQAGDGGFAVKVKGNTDLHGGVIASTQAAEHAGVNRLETGTLTTTDIENTSHYKAKGVNLSGGYSFAEKKNSKSDAADAHTPDINKPTASTVNNGSKWSLQQFKTGGQGVALGISNKQGKDQSTTHSGISGGAIAITNAAGQEAKTGQSVADTQSGLNRTVHSGDASDGLTKQWDGQQLHDQVQNNAQIMATFGQQAAQTIGDYADHQAQAAQARGDTAGANHWSEGGAYRVLAHTLAGAAGGGLGGAIGAGAAAASAPTLNNLSNTLPKGLGSVVSTVAGAGIGYAAGGEVGAATALNTDANNRQLHPDEVKWIKDHAHAFAQSTGTSDSDAEQRLAQQALRQVDKAWEGYLGADTDTSAQAYLQQGSKSQFTNADGAQQPLFTARNGEQYDGVKYAAQIASSPANVQWYQRSVQPGTIHPSTTGALASAGWQTAKELPGQLIGGVAQAITHPIDTATALPGAIKDSVVGAGNALGGAGAALNPAVSGQLQTLYGQANAPAVVGTIAASPAAALLTPIPVGKAVAVFKPAAKAAGAGVAGIAEAADLPSVNQAIETFSYKETYQLSTTWLDQQGRLTWINPLTNQREVIPAGVPVQIDHILPKNGVKKIPGFEELPQDVKNEIFKDPDNLQPMAGTTNQSKGCKVESCGAGFDHIKGQPVNAEYKEYLQKKQQQFRKGIEDKITKYKSSLNKGL